MCNCKREKTDSYNELLEKFLKLKIENDRLEKQNDDIQNSHMQLYNDTKDEIRRLKEENEALRTEIMELKKRDALPEYIKSNLKAGDACMKGLLDGIEGSENKCCRNCSCEDDLPFSDDELDINDLLCELQDQHQQDCIRVNDLTTTVNVLIRLYVNLRKNVGMD